MKDIEIVELYWQRSEKAITATSEKYENYLYSISYNILHNIEDTKECLNDTYLSAWNSMPPNKPNRLAIFLGKITRNISLNRFKYYTAEKRRGSQTDIILSELNDCIPSCVNTERVAEEKILVSAIEEFLYSQPLVKRNIFLRRYWYGCSVTDVAKEYSMTEGKVASLLFRMRKALKIKLEKEDIAL